MRTMRTTRRLALTLLIAVTVLGAYLVARRGNPGGPGPGDPAAAAPFSH